MGSGEGKGSRLRQGWVCLWHAKSGAQTPQKILAAKKFRS